MAVRNSMPPSLLQFRVPRNVSHRTLNLWPQFRESCWGHHRMIYSSDPPSSVIVVTRRLPFFQCHARVRRRASWISIEKMLPDFARARRARDIPVVIMHQDAFAADYQKEEYRLIGMATKFAWHLGQRTPPTRMSRKTFRETLIKCSLSTGSIDKVVPA